MKFHTTLKAMLLAGAALLLSGQAVVAAAPTKITLSPATATVTADQTQTYTVTTDGTPADVTSASTLSMTDPLGSITGATYHPGKAGTWTVQATYQSFKTTATVTVTPGAAAEVAVNPNTNPELTNIGTPRTFTATVFDSHSNTISNASVTWSVIGDVGTIDANGVFTPTKLGTGKVQAKNGAIVGEVAVQVNAALPTNTNTAANTNATRNANANKNTNATIANANLNAATTNVNATNTNTTASTTDTTKCTTLKTWVWIVILAAFLVAVYIFYMMVPVSAIWPVITALVAAGVLAYIQRKYGCGTQSWWAWVATLGTVLLTAVSLRQRPKNPTM